MKPKPDQTTVDWTRAKGLLADLKSHVRRSVAAQVLMGKELASLKKKLGFVGPGRRQKEFPQCAGIVRDWPTQCRENLGISDDTADRWIRCFESATERAKARRNKARRENNADELITWELACRLLTIPAEELDGRELEQLAECVGRIVDHDSQADLLDELGISKRPNGPPIGEKKKPEDPMSHTRSWVSGSVESIYNQFSELTEMIRDVRTADEFRVGIHELPLTHPEPDKLSLYKLKGVLDELVSSEVAGMIKFVDDEIKSRSAGSPLKPARKPKTTRR